MITSDFLKDKFYINMGGGYINHNIPSKFKGYFENDDNSGLYSYGACGLDSNDNVLIKNTYSFCTNYDSDTDTCNGSYFATASQYYVLTKDNNLIEYNKQYFQPGFDDSSMICYGNIVISQNYYDDFLYTGQTSDILPLMLYFSIPLLIVLFAVKVFRKGVH